MQYLNEIMQMEELSVETFSECKLLFERFSDPTRLEVNEPPLTGLTRKYATTSVVPLPQSMMESLAATRRN